MRRQMTAAALISAFTAAFAGQALALGCTATTPTPGHTLGSAGYTDIPIGPCPVGHYAALQKKRNGGALFGQPTTTPNPQANTPQ